MIYKINWTKLILSLAILIIWLFVGQLILQTITETLNIQPEQTNNYMQYSLLGNMDNLFYFMGFILFIGVIASAFSGTKENEEETTEELPQRSEYQATLECQNCNNEIQIPIVKGYDIEEAIKLGDYYCKICGSKNIKRKKPYWEN